MAPLASYFFLSLGLEWLALAPFLDMPRLRLFGRVLIINTLAALVILVIGLTQTLYGDWLFLSSWGMRDLFLLSAAIELPFAWIALPRMPFTKFFSLVIIANFCTALVATGALATLPATPWYANFAPAALESEVVDGGMTIRAAVEKFRTNHGGQVPTYLSGGDPGSWRGFRGSDRLLQEGLLEVYPKNPLHLGRGYLAGRRRWTLPGLFFGQQEAEFQQLRDAWEFRATSGRDPRFGLLGVRMGNLLSDPRVHASSEPARYQLGAEGPALPGSFFYRAYDLDGDGRLESYLLGVLGAEGTLGVDAYDAVNDQLLAQDAAGHLIPASDGIPDQIIWMVGGGFLAEYPWSATAPGPRLPQELSPAETLP